MTSTLVKFSEKVFLNELILLIILKIRDGPKKNFSRNPIKFCEYLLNLVLHGESKCAAGEKKRHYLFV